MKPTLTSLKRNLPPIKNVSYPHNWIIKFHWVPVYISKTTLDSMTFLTFHDENSKLSFFSISEDWIWFDNELGQKQGNSLFNVDCYILKLIQSYRKVWKVLRTKRKSLKTYPSCLQEQNHHTELNMHIFVQFFTNKI